MHAPRGKDTLLAFTLGHVLTISLSASAAGQSPSQAVETTGRFALGATTMGPAPGIYLAGDATLRASVARLGFELGIYGRVDSDGTPHETYGSVTFDLTPAMRLAAGVPRPAFDRFTLSYLETAFPAMSVTRARSLRSRATSGAMFDGWVPYGVAAYGTLGGFEYAASLHHSAAPGGTILGIGGRKTFGLWTLSGALETVQGETRAQGMLGATFGSVSGATRVTLGAHKMIELGLAWQALDRLKVIGVGQIPMDHGSAALAGGSLRYDVNTRLAVSLGALVEDGSGTAITGFLDWQF